MRAHAGDGCGRRLTGGRKGAHRFNAPRSSEGADSFLEKSGQRDGGSPTRESRGGESVKIRTGRKAYRGGCDEGQGQSFMTVVFAGSLNEESRCQIFLIPFRRSKG